MMTPNNSKASEADNKNDRTSIRDATDSNSNNGGALFNFSALPSPYHTLDNLDHGASSVVNSSIQNIGTTDVIKCTSTTLGVGKQSSDSSSSSNDHSSDSSQKTTIQQTNRSRRNTHPKRRRRRKELMSQESFFVNAHQELLFRYGPRYREFVIPFEPQPKEPVKARRGRERKES